MSNVHATQEIIVLPASTVSPQIPDTSPHPAPGLTTGLPGSDAASDDGPPKGDTCLASASASSVSPERRVAWEPLARQMPDIEEAIAQQASLILPHIPDPFSEAALNDGPPKADTFFVSAREHVSSSLRSNAPILIIAVVVAPPALCVHVVLNREVTLPIIRGNNTYASMDSVRAHGYMESGMLGAPHLCFLFLGMIVMSLIQGHPTSKWYSVFTFVVNFVNTSIHSVCWHCALLYSLDQGMMSLGLSALNAMIQVPLNFGIAHIFLQKYVPGSLWWHMPLCYLCFLMEFVNAIAVKQSTFYLHSDLFKWTAPFLFSLSSMFTRRAGEWSVVPPSAASKICTVSLALCVMLTRLAQSAEINDPWEIVKLEVFYAALSVFVKVSSYSRHAIISFFMTGKCKVRGVPRKPRAQSITTISNVTESIFDMGFFIILFLSRFLLLPSSITATVFTLVFCICIAIQILANTTTFTLVSYFEGIPIEDFCISWTSLGDFMGHCFHVWVVLMFGIMYYNPVILNVWDPSIREGEIPWK